MRPGSGNRSDITTMVTHGASSDTPATSELCWWRSTNSLAARYSNRRRTGNVEDKDTLTRGARMAGSPRRTTCGRATHGGGRLPGGAELLHRVGAGRVSVVAHSRATEGWRSITISVRRAPLGR